MIKILIAAVISVTFFTSPAPSLAETADNTEADNKHDSAHDIGNENRYTPGLGEIMAATQMRHSKLWFAGAAGNWKLAEYELFELNEGFDDAIKFHPLRTAPLLKIMQTPLEQLKTAILKNNSTEFKRAFDNLTRSCNACHADTDFGFNKVITPASNPYTNQSF